MRSGSPDRRRVSPRCPHGRRGAGFTLVEGLIATVLMLLLAIGIWGFQSAGFLQVSRTQKKLTAVRTAHLLYERLHRDLVGAHTLLILPPGPVREENGNKILPVRTFFIDGEEYIHDPNLQELRLAGQVWTVGRLEHVSLELGSAGRVRVRIAAVSDGDLSSPTAKDRARPARAVMEGLVVVDALRDAQHYPYVLSEERDLHGYCSTGNPIDY